jgi:hypothetical protein
MVGAIAPHQLIAEMWRDLLLGHGIPAQLRAGDSASYLGVSTIPCRVLVPEDQLDQAHTMLEEFLTPENESEIYALTQDEPFT